LNVANFSGLSSGPREVEVGGVIFEELCEVMPPPAWIAMLIEITGAKCRTTSNDGECQRRSEDGHDAICNFRFVEA
jgi:hypothetical protein